MIFIKNLKKTKGVCKNLPDRKLKNRINNLNSVESLLKEMHNVDQISFDIKFNQIFDKINTSYINQNPVKYSDKVQLFKDNFDAFKIHINQINSQEVKNNIVSSLILNLFMIEDYQLLIEWHAFIESNKNSVSENVKFILKNKISSIEKDFENCYFYGNEQSSKQLVIYFYCINILNLDKNKIILILLTKNTDINDKNYNFDKIIENILEPLNKRTMNNFINLVKESLNSRRNVNSKTFEFAYNLFLTKNLNIITLIKEDFFENICFSSNYEFMIFLLENNFTASDSFLKKALIRLFSCHTSDINYDKAKFLDIFLEKISNKNHHNLHKKIAETSRFPKDEELQKLLPVLIKHNVDVNREEYHNWIAYFAQNIDNLEFFKEHNIKYTPYCLLWCLTNNTEKRTNVEEKLSMIDFFIQQNIDINEEFYYKSKNTNILIAYCDYLEAFSKRNEEGYLCTDMRIIEKLITSGIDINVVINKNTALSIAVYKRQTEVIKFLLLHNTDVKNSDLKIALKPFKQNPPDILIVLMLLAKNVALDESDKINPIITNASTIKNNFFKAIGDNDLLKMKEFINKGYGFLVNAIDNDGPIISKYEGILSPEMLDLLAEFMPKRGRHTKSARKK